MKNIIHTIASLGIVLSSFTLANAGEPRNVTLNWVESETDNAQLREQLDGLFHYPRHLVIDNPSEVFVHLYISENGDASVVEVYSSSNVLKEYVRAVLESHRFEGAGESGHYEFVIRFALI